MGCLRSGKLIRSLLCALAGYASVSLQGCLPPDWSFCDCDFRDNFWNSILNDVHLLWDVRDGPDFVRKARDNTTFQGKYLQSPPDDLNCPVAPAVFWKAWPQYGITRGLIEGSMGDLWMPGARDRFKQVCIAGHIALLAICSQHFLVKSARAQDSGDPDHMKWLEAAYSHMVAIRNLGQAYQIRNCMGQQGWSLDVGAFHKYTERWIGREAEGTAPQAAFFNGKVDAWQMLFTNPMAHTTESRAAMLPDRKTCAPYKDPACWKRKSLLLMETCEYCCSPFQHKGGRGADICWDSEWTFERCCQQDFKDLICELNRKGEEGGCVDCKKTVTYICLTPTEKRLKDAQNKYNENVDLFNKLQNKSQELAQNIHSAREDLLNKDQVYRSLHQDLNDKLSHWHFAYYNASRLSSLARLRQQETTWNNSNFALNEAAGALSLAQSSVLNASRVLADARKQEETGREALRKNLSEYQRSVNAFETTSDSLALAKSKKSAAEEACASAESAVSFAKGNASEMLAASQRANVSRDQRYMATDDNLTNLIALRDSSRETTSEILNSIYYVQTQFQTMRSQGARTCLGSIPLTTNDAAMNKLRLAEQSWIAAHAARNQLAEDLLAARQYEEQTKDLIAQCSGSSGSAGSGARPSMLCLIMKTPANQSRPQIGQTPLCHNKEACLSPTECLRIGQKPVAQPVTCECNQTNTLDIQSRFAQLLEQLFVAERLSQQALSKEKEKQRSETEKEGTDVDNPIYVPMELTNVVEARSKAAAETKKKQGESVQAMQEAGSLLERLKADRDTLSKKKEFTVKELESSQQQTRQLVAKISLWEEYVRTNATSFDETKKAHKSLVRTAESLALTAEEAANQSNALSLQRLVAINESLMGRHFRDETAKKLSHAEEQVQKMNRTLSDNLTVLVSAWLQQQETAKVFCSKLVFSNCMHEVHSFFRAFCCWNQFACQGIPFSKME